MNTTSTRTDLEVLDSIQRRVLWLATNIVHHANRVRPNPEASKVGGHQASSASVVSILTSLYFDFLQAGDRVSVKPHASPVFHAIQYLLGNLDASYLPRLREFKGLQAYPSRTKDPDPVDFSTGSVGLGCIAPNYAALVERYVHDHFPSDAKPARYISVLGDAELDEGSVWETIAEPALEGVGNIIWVVDLNRQSLDRVIPGIRAERLMAMFAANGWDVIEAKYGNRLTTLFDRTGGDVLRALIDEMSNEEYQSLLRVDPSDLPARLDAICGKSDAKKLAKLRSGLSASEFADAFGDLGGHDLALLRSCLQRADKSPAPAVIFAYTIKGWGLPIAGDPMNHSALLEDDEMKQLRSTLDVGDSQEWPTFDSASAEGELIEKARVVLSGRAEARPLAKVSIPQGVPGGYPSNVSTQRAFGLAVVRIARESPELAKRMVTTSPDVATSTNLAGWLNKNGAWSAIARDAAFAGEERLVRWDYRPEGQHVELGISENNLFCALGQLGLSHELHGELLFPIGTLYDPFVCRGLDAFIYGLYSGSRFVVAGTPSGVTLSWEGGAHQSVITSSIGAELPKVTFWEPAFAREVEWILLEAFDQIALRDKGESAYLRLSTRNVDQALFAEPKSEAELKARRDGVLSGGYRLVDHSQRADYHPGHNVVTLFTSGAMVTEALEASRLLADDEIWVDVVNVTSSDRLFRRYQQRTSGQSSATLLFTDLVPEASRRGPVVSVVDAHPASLAWIGSALGVEQFPLGVSDFGQSGSRQQVYESVGIDTESIAQACISALWSANPASRPF